MKTTIKQPEYTDCRNCGTADHSDYLCPCACHPAQKTKATYGVLKLGPTHYRAWASAYQGSAHTTIQTDGFATYTEARADLERRAEKAGLKLHWFDGEYDMTKKEA